MRAGYFPEYTFREPRWPDLPPRLPRSRRMAMAQLRWLGFLCVAALVGGLWRERFCNQDRAATAHRRQSVAGTVGAADGRPAARRDRGHRWGSTADPGSASCSPPRPRSAISMRRLCGWVPPASPTRAATLRISRSRCRARWTAPRSTHWRRSWMASRGILLAVGSRQLAAKELPNKNGATAPVDELQHLLPSGFPAAWNLRSPGPGQLRRAPRDGNRA